QRGAPCRRSTRPAGRDPRDRRARPSGGGCPACAPGPNAIGGGTWGSRGGPRRCSAALGAGRPARAAAPVLVVAALAAPPAREWLEATMVRHMLVQLPLIALCGFVLGRGLL